MKTFYPIQVIDLGFQIDYITAMKLKLFDEYETAAEHNSLYVILRKHEETKTVSNGSKITGIKLIWDRRIDNIYYTL